MRTRPPDFFLGSSEHRGDWARARTCWVKSRLHTEDGREGVLVRIDPPVIGQAFGLGNRDIFDLILVPRWNGVKLDRIDKPTPVLVYRTLDPSIGTTDVVRNTEIDLSAWGEVYPSLEAAESVENKSKL